MPAAVAVKTVKTTTTTKTVETHVVQPAKTLIQLKSMKVMRDDNTGRTNLRTAAHDSSVCNGVVVFNDETISVLQEDPDSEFTYIQVGRKKGYINKAYLIELCPDVLMSMI